MQQTLHQIWFNAGFDQTLSVIPSNANLGWTPEEGRDPRGKAPGTTQGGEWFLSTRWPESQADIALAQKWDREGANVGLKMGLKWIALDVDIIDPEMAQKLRNVLRFDLLAATAPIRVGRAPKFLLLFALAPGEQIRKRQHRLITPDGQKGQLIEVLGLSSNGLPSQAVVAGMHPCGTEYHWDREVRPDALPVVTEADVDRLVELCVTTCEASGWKRGGKTGGGKMMGDVSPLAGEATDKQVVIDVLKVLDNSADLYPYDDFIPMMLAIKYELGDIDGREPFLNWSAKATDIHNERTSAAEWDDSNEPNSGANFGKLVTKVREQKVVQDFMRIAGVPIPQNTLVTDDLLRRVSNETNRKSSTVKAKAVMPEIAGLQPLPGMIVHSEPLTGFTPPASGAYVSGDEAPVLIPAAGADGEVIGTYVYKADGYTKAPVSHNVMLELVTHPVWEGVFRYDDFAGQMRVVKPLPDHPSDVPFTPRFLIDGDYLSVHAWCQQQIGWTTISKQAAADGLDMIEKHVSYDPLIEYLDGLTPPTNTLPGGTLLDTWLFKFMGVKYGSPDENRYVSQIGRKWLISAVARAYQPGCQVDSAIVLEGPQGGGKSSALAIMAVNEDWFGDSLPDFHKPDASLYLTGKWIVELAELTNILKSEIEDMRRFVTRRIEKYRQPYGRKDVVQPRRCVLAGSTNRDDYLKDATGERRMWPVVVGVCDLNGLRSARDQLWAEAVAAYKSGEVWYLPDDVAATATEVQKSKVERDDWQDDIEAILAGRIMRQDGMTLMQNEAPVPFQEFTPHMLREHLKMTKAQWNNGLSFRVGRVMKGLGWIKEGKVSGGRFMGLTCWKRPL